MICIALACFAALGGTAAYFYQNREEIDAATHCPTKRLVGITAVLIDLTDPINKTQAVYLRKMLDELRNDTPRYSRLDLYTITDAAGTKLDPLVSLCSPGSAKDIDSNLTGNPEYADRVWKRDFGSKIDAMLDRALQVTPMEASPILEAVQFVAVRSFGSDKERAAPNRRLLIFSDMLHHSRELSLYQPAPRHQDFRRTQYYARVKPQLYGAVVDMRVLVRDTRRNVQNAALAEFWLQHFKESGSAGPGIDSWDIAQ